MAGLGRVLEDQPRLRVADFTVEKFATWKISLRNRDYSPELINHYLSAIRAMFTLADQTGLLEKAPRLKRTKNERIPGAGSEEKPVNAVGDLKRLLRKADLKLKTMIVLALNCGFGPKDLQDLAWDDIQGERITLPPGKTGVWQTYLLRRGKAAPGIVAASIWGVLAIRSLASIILETRSQSQAAYGVIISGEVVARQGDGPNYPESLEEPLHSGTEFDLLKRCPGWFQIRPSDGSSGWISDNSADIM